MREYGTDGTLDSMAQTAFRVWLRRHFRQYGTDGTLEYGTDGTLEYGTDGTLHSMAQTAL